MLWVIYKEIKYPNITFLYIKLFQNILYDTKNNFPKTQASNIFYSLMWYR